MSPLKAIRKNCLECMGGSYEGVAACTSPKCNLFAFRSGHLPVKEGGKARKGHVESLRKWKEAQAGTEGKLQG